MDFTGTTALVTGANLLGAPIELGVRRVYAAARDTPAGLRGQVVPARLDLTGPDRITAAPLIYLGSLDPEAYELASSGR